MIAQSFDAPRTASDSIWSGPPFRGPPRDIACPSMAQSRYRCGSCGNLTRFDLVVTRSVRECHYVTVGGKLAIDGAEVLSETVDGVTCQWCGHGQEVVELGHKEH